MLTELLEGLTSCSGVVIQRAPPSSELGPRAWATFTAAAPDSPEAARHAESCKSGLGRQSKKLLVAPHTAAHHPGSRDRP